MAAICAKRNIVNARPGRSRPAPRLRWRRPQGRVTVHVPLLDAKGEPRLESTNDFLVWFCERCDIVTKKSVVEKAESWLKACGDLSRAKFDPDGAGSREGIFTEAMHVRIAICVV